MHANEKWFKDSKRIALLMQKTSNRILKDLQAINNDRFEEAIYSEEQKDLMLKELRELRILFNEMEITLHFRRAEGSDA